MRSQAQGNSRSMAHFDHVYGEKQLKGEEDNFAFGLDDQSQEAASSRRRGGASKGRKKHGEGQQSASKKEGKPVGCLGWMFGRRRRRRINNTQKISLPPANAQGKQVHVPLGGGVSSQFQQAQSRLEQIEKSKGAGDGRKLTKVGMESTRQIQQIGAEISGTLFKKTTHGKWHPRQFVLKGNELSWLKSDQVTQLSLVITPDTAVQDLPIGLKRFMFEVSVPGQDTLVLAAAGEVEKFEWIRAISAKTNTPMNTELNGPAGKPTPANRGSIAQIKKGAVKDIKKDKSTADAIIAGLNKNANQRVREKLNKTKSVTGGTHPSCSSCEQPCYKYELVQMKLPSGEEKIFHRHCYICGDCQAPLTTEDFAIRNNFCYCSRHAPPAAQSTMVIADMPPVLQIAGRLLDTDRVFRIVTDDIRSKSKKGKSEYIEIWICATSKVERDHWVISLCSQVCQLEMTRVLHEAQKVDMQSAIECQMDLQHFMERTSIAYDGYLDQFMVKGQRGWKRRYFALDGSGNLRYTRKEKTKQLKALHLLSPNTKILDAHGHMLSGPLVCKTPEAS